MKYELDKIIVALLGEVRAFGDRMHDCVYRPWINQPKKEQKMTREEAILEIDCILFEQDHPNRKELRKALKQPPTLADFLGWEEGQEYNLKGTTIKIEKNNIYKKNEKCSSGWCNFYVSGEELLVLRKAKKEEPPKPKAYHVKDEYSYDCLIKELVEKGYTKTLGGYLTIKTSYYNLVKETTRNYIYLHDNDRVSFSHELVRDGYDIIEYHKEEPKYYAKIKGNDLLNSNFVYVNYNTISERLALGIKSERGNWKTNFTKKEWKNLGVTDENFDLKEVE